MEYIVTVTEGQSTQQLIHETLYHIQIDVTVQTIEIFFQILIAMLKDKRQFFIRMKYVVQTNDVLVFQFLQMNDRNWIIWSLTGTAPARTDVLLANKSL